MLHNLDHRLLEVLRLQNIQGTGINIAISGGVDSVVLLRSFKKIAKMQALALRAYYVHHGATEDTKLLSFRDLCQQFCEDLCKQQEVPFQALGPSPAVLKGEEQMRDFRYQQLRLQLSADFSWIATAHHADDLLETRLLRLLRGTGPDGLEGIVLKENNLLRPFLQISRAEILDYAKLEDLKHLEDPSNQDQSLLRNWLRQTWLRDLELRYPGAQQSLARSLGLLVENLNEATKSTSVIVDGKIQRRDYNQLSLPEQKLTLASYVRGLGGVLLSHSQVLEIHKRLAAAAGVSQFFVAGLDWQADAQQIVAFKRL